MPTRNQPPLTNWFACSRRRRPGMRRSSNQNFPRGDGAATRFAMIAVGGLLLGASGCECISPKPKTNPPVIAVPGETVPHRIRRGQPSDYDGWVVPTPLFNELAPCFRRQLETPGSDPSAEPAAREVERPWLKFPGARGAIAERRHWRWRGMRN